MEKRRSVSSVQGRRAGRKIRLMPDSEINFDDIPESTDEELARAKRVGRPSTGNAKQIIAIRLHPKLITSLRKMAQKQSKPYQTLINEILERAVQRAA